MDKGIPVGSAPDILRGQVLGRWREFRGCRPDRRCEPPLIFGMQIDAGSLDRRVAQVLLDEAQVGTRIGLMGRCAVPAMSLTT